MKQKWSRKFVKYFINHGFHLKCDAVLFGEEELPKFLSYFKLPFKIRWFLRKLFYDDKRLSLDKFKRIFG